MSTFKAAENDDKKYKFFSPRKQCFSFPSDVISSMLKQPSSPNGLLKLYQTCKYFYSKKQILIMSDSKFDRSRFYYGEYNPKLLIGDFWDENYSDVQHLLWHTDKLQILHYNDRYFEKPEYLEKNRIPKFYRFSIKELELYKTVLSVDDFLLITAEKQIQTFTIHRDSWISNSDYSKVDLAEIFKFEVMPKLQFLTCYRDATNCTNEIFEKLSKIQL
uniref:FCP1 homology domain-containing protein n=1 Tax=Panagrolaimus davidi TaxID=227884 RepID=A0A914Q510_9BILA